MNHRITIALVLASAIVAAGCDEPGTAPETITPVSASVTVAPLPEASTVATTDSVIVDFGVAVDTATCADAFRLHLGDTLGPEVPGRLRFANAYRRMIFVPDPALQARTRYHARVRDSVEVGDGTGDRIRDRERQRLMLDQPPNGALRYHDGMGWSFTTGD